MWRIWGVVSDQVGQQGWIGPKGVVGMLIHTKRSNNLSGILFEERGTSHVDCAAGEALAITRKDP